MAGTPQFDVRSSDFADLNQAFTEAANELDPTGGRFTPDYASTVSDHRGLSLSSGTATLGFLFPVPADSRLTPRTSPGPSSPEHRAQPRTDLGCAPVLGAGLGERRIAGRAGSSVHSSADCRTRSTGQWGEVGDPARASVDWWSNKGLQPTRPLEEHSVRCTLTRRFSTVRRAAEAGMTTAEYAVGTLAACAFAAVLLAVVRSGTVKSALASVIAAALGSVG